MSGIVNSNQAQVLQIMNQQVPKKGFGVAIQIDLTANGGIYLADFSNYEWQGKIDFFQTLFLDLSQSGVPIAIMDLTTGHEIVADPHTQGFYNFITMNPTKLLITGPGGPAAFKMLLTNLPIPGAVWSATHP